MASKRKKEPKMAPLGGEEDRPKGLEKEEKDWGDRLIRAKYFQSKYSSQWDENRRLIFSEMSSSKDASGGSTPPWAGGRANQVAYGWGLYEGLETTIYVQNPDVIASSHEGGNSAVARRITQILKYDLDIMNTKDIGNLCLLDTFISGYGAIIECVETYHKRDAEDVKTGEVDGQEFEFRRVDPRDILFDPASRRLDLSDAKYIFVAWYPTIEELREDPNITDLPEGIGEFPECTEYTRATNPPEGSAERQAATLANRAGGAAEKDPAYKTICIWEVYDKIGHRLKYLTDYKHLIIGEHHDGNGKPDWPVNLRFGCRDLYPVTLLYQHPIPGRFYPRPEAELIAPQLREINVVERIISEQSTTKRRKYFTWANLLSEDQKAKVNDTSVANDLIFLDGTKLQDALGLAGSPDAALYNINNVIARADEIAPPPDLMPRYAMLEQEIFHIVGYGPNQRGGLPSTRSAREAMMINSEKERKLDKRRDRITDFYRAVSMKHVRFLQKYMSVERYAKVLPKSGDLNEWVKYDRNSIGGDFEFDVVAGSSTPKNTEVRKATEQALFQAAAPIILQAGGDIRPAFYRLAEYMDWDNVDEVFSGLKQKGQEAAQLLVGFNKGLVPPEQLLSAYARLLMAVLTPAEFEMEKQKLEGGGGGGQATPGQANTPRGDANPNATSMGVPG